MIMIRYTAKDVKDMLRKELRDYEARIGFITPDERKELRDWVARGNQAVCNPWYIAGEDGCPLDYITAKRIIDDMWLHPEDYGIGCEPESANTYEDGELPF